MNYSTCMTMLDSREMIEAKIGLIKAKRSGNAFAIKQAKAHYRKVWKRENKDR